MSDLKIVVATHKAYGIPDQPYLIPVFAGSAISDLKLPYQRDDEGENISSKNKTYCELTALFWTYKHLKADFIGLFHYRRYLDIDNVRFENEQVILPRKRHYYIETVYDQFKHAHGSFGLDVTREVIQECYPSYLEAFDEQMNKRSLHLYNMFIMRYDLFIDYCVFLFDVLEKVENKLGDVPRLYGYLGERLLDVYILKNKISYREVKVINKEPENWARKIFNFLKRKYRRG